MHERLRRKRLPHSRIRRICNTSALGGFLERRGKAREEERFEACSSDGCGILLVMETPRCGRVEGFSEQEMSSGLAKKLHTSSATALLFRFWFGQTAGTVFGVEVKGEEG